MSVGGGVVFSKMEVAPGTSGERVPMEQTCGLHGGGFPEDTIILSIKEQSDFQGGQEHICSSVQRDETIGVIELHVLKARLGRTTV